MADIILTDEVWGARWNEELGGWQDLETGAMISGEGE